MQKIILLGSGGNSAEILDVLHALNRHHHQPKYECVGILDDAEEKWGTKLSDVPILGPLSSAGDYPDCQFINGIGSPSTFRRKADILHRVAIPSDRYETIIHPTAYVSPTVKLGDGVVIFPNVTITSNVTIGNQVIILSGTVLNHDDVIGDYTCIASGVCVSGAVTVGPSCYLGCNASLIQNITIGEGSLVGIGAVVLRDVRPNTVVVGNPARELPPKGE